MIKKYKSVKPPIEAVQLTKENMFDIGEWILLNKGICETKEYINGALYLEIETLEGDMEAAIGDYVIKGIKGEFYPCKPDIFEASYEEIK